MEVWVVVESKEAIEDIKNNIQPIVGGKSLEIAIEALEKQIQKKPIYVTIDYEDCTVCPTCNVSRIDYTNKRPDYCPWCGQNFDWEDNSSGK